MSPTSPRALRLAAALTVCVMASACGTFDNVSNRLVGSIAPYKVEVVQGNFVAREQVEAIKPGMNRQQVRDILGTPLVSSVFHADRWDYVFTLKRQGLEPQQRKLAVFFRNNLLERFEGDEMPSEAEFVASLGRKGKAGKVPELEASEEALKQFSTPRPPAAGPGSTAALDAAQAPAAAAPAASYPPLEEPAR